LQLKGWKDLAIGAVMLEPGSCLAYETGSWRTQRPILDLEKCAHCFICWIFCPESSIQVRGGKVTGIDLTYCKGCGICSAECPRQAIDMVMEATARKGAKDEG